MSPRKPRRPPRRPDPEPGGDALEDPFEPAAETADGEGVRLNKFLAERGVASRRRCDELIAGGLVTVDDRIVTQLGTRIDPARAKVEVDGVVLRPDAQRRYYLLNKPRGVVCTNEVREARPRAIDLIDDPDRGRIYTVGRLDEESEGLILLTSDGEFAQRVAHPRYGVTKTYLVKLRGRVGGEEIERLRRGVHLAEGRTGGALLRVIKRSSQWTQMEVTLSEGRNREIRRIFAAVGHKVQTLKRVAIGELTDRRLKPGQWRPLVRAEVLALSRASDPHGAGGAAQGPRVKVRRPATQGRRFGKRAAQHWTALRQGAERGTRPPRRNDEAKGVRRKPR
jgi:23S rRNA pseudouridine2605 synthase